MQLWTVLGLIGVDSYRPLFVLYGIIGLLNTLLFTRLSDRVELAGRFRILHVASLVAVKGQRTLLEAMVHLKQVEPGAHLHLAGDGPLRAELEAYGQGLEDKREIVALTKIDALTPEIIRQQAARLKRASKTTPLLLSAQSGKGVIEAKRALLEIIDSSGGTTAARRRAEAPAWQP